MAFQSLGVSVWTLAAPALVLSAIVSWLSAQTTFSLGPWGNRQFEILMTHIGSSKAEATIKEGTFSEGFFDFVIYANKVNSREGRLEKVFLYDERDSNQPLTIIAKEGLLIRSSTLKSQDAILRLLHGNIHRVHDSQYTKIDFESYDLFLSNPVALGFKEKTLNSLTLDEIKQQILDKKTEPSFLHRLKIEFHKRWAISLACILFALVGVGLGATIHRRRSSSSGLVICIGLIIFYWVIYLVGESLAKNHTLPPSVGLWLANIAFASFGSWKLLRISRVT